jgi:P pilus assembly chaperone PapD
MKQTGRAFYKFLMMATCMFLMVSATKVIAQGNLLITPKRVVFDGSRRSEELNLANIGKDSATYIVSFIQIRMNEDGTFQTITEPDTAQFFADKNLRYFPRTVTLAPNEAQTVKVQLTRTTEMSTGEYRSHLYFRAVPKEKPLGDRDAEKDTAISVRLIPVFGISIPVIIRVGELTANVNISSASLRAPRDTVPVLDLTFKRTGNMSVYGDINVEHISPQGKVTRVGSVKGMAVYTPTPLRQYHLPLDSSKDIDYRSGKLHIVYTDQSTKPVKLAEEEVFLSDNLAVTETTFN